MRTSGGAGLFMAVFLMACSGSSSSGNRDPAGVMDVPVLDAGAEFPAADVPDGGVRDESADPQGSETQSQDGLAPEEGVGPAADIVGGCESCAYGSISGLTCAPNGTTTVPNVSVWVDTLDCDGKPLHIETLSDAKGIYQLDGVPCGNQTVRVEKGSYKHDYTIFVEAGMVNDASAATRCFKSAAAKIAVITGRWDHIEYILNALKLKYDLFDSQDVDESYGWGNSQALNLLTDQKKLLAYDVLFINCGKIHSEIAGNPQVKANLDAFVKKGGSLYGSDYADVYINQVWPWAMDEPDPYSIFAQTVHAEVLDPPLVAYVGTNQQDIKYQLGPISTIKGPGTNPNTGAVTFVHIRGEFKEYPGELRPIMLSFSPYPPKGGRVIFANFHHEEQTGVLLKQVAAILNYVVFQL